jgi:hypothetical protein
MKISTANKFLFLGAVIAGVLLFALPGTEPWDSLYGWVEIVGLGLVFGFVGKGKPWLWPIGIFLGEFLYGAGSFAKSYFFYSGGGANFFFPVGLMYLVPFTVPAFIGSFIGAGVRRVFTRK